MTSTVVSATANPFVGPKALTEEDTLFGRSVELKTLHAMLIADRIVLLYSPSGAGKTSLLHAGLKPLLVQDGFVVRPTIRVTHEVPPALGEHSPRNRYLLSTLLSLEAGRSKELEVATLADISLDEYLTTTRAISDADDTECLIFDQFEELFTVDPIDVDEKEAFIEEVSQALRNSSRWAVFSMREDFVAYLDPSLKLIPTKLRSRFRLDLLGPEPALQAIQGPAREAGVEFSTEAAALVVDDLRTVLVQRGADVVPEKGPTVEPVQLQVVCHRLWTRLGDVSRIEPEHVRELGDVDNALRDFYDDVVSEVAERTGVSERAIRTWISDELVTEQGFRAQTQRGPTEDTLGRVLPDLEDTHLLRADRRRTTVWYELAHDRLVDPINFSNSLWLEEHLSVLQRGARLWDAQRRDDRALLVGPQLEAADAWAASHPDELGEVERDFLEASHEEEARVAHEQRSARRTRRLAIAATVVSLFAIAGLIAAIWQWQKVEDAKDRAERVERATAYFLGAESSIFDTRTRFLLDRMALDTLPADRPPPVFMLQAINSHLYSSFLEQQKSFGTSPGIASLSANGQFVAAVTNDGVRVVDLNASDDPGSVSILPVELPADASVSLALSHDGGLLAVVPSSSSNPGELWDVAQQKKIRDLEAVPGSQSEWQLEFLKSDTNLAGISYGAAAAVWDVDSGQVSTQQLGSGEIQGFDVSSTGLVAVADIDGNLRVVELATGAELFELGSREVMFAAFDQAGERLAVTTSGALELFAVPSGDSLGSIPIDGNTYVTFLGSYDSDTLLILAFRENDSGSCNLQRWNIDGQQGDNLLIDCPELLASISDDGQRMLSIDTAGWSVLSTDDGRELKTSAPPQGTVSAGGPVLALVDSDQRVAVRTWTGEAVYTSPPGDSYQQVAVDHDGDTIVASSDHDVVVIDLSSEEVMSRTTLPWRPDRISTSDDAGLVAVASADGQLLRWKASENADPEEFGSSGEIRALAVTGSGGAVAVATDEALTIYADDGTSTTIEERAISIATAPSSDALAAIVTRASSEPEADPSEQIELFLWDDVAEEHRSIPLSVGRPTAIALTREYVVIASDQGIDVFNTRTLQLAGGIKRVEFWSGLPTEAVSIFDTEEPTVASATSEGTTTFTFKLDREGIRNDLETAVSKNEWKELSDVECRRVTGVACL